MSSSPARVPATVPSGVEGLDHVLGGGLRTGATLLFVGPPGSGKTTVALQIAFHRARAGENVVFVSTAAEPAPRLLRHLRGYAFFDEGLVGTRVHLLGLYPSGEGDGPDPLTGLVDAVRRTSARVVVLDDLSVLRQVVGGPLELRTFLHDLGGQMAVLGCIALLTESGGVDLARTSERPELTMCDGVLELGQSERASQARRTVRVWKMRGAPSLVGSHAARIDGRGLAVFPQAESLPLPVPPLPSRGRVSSGFAELDDMTGGGLPGGSVTMLAGAPGTGKSILGLQYLMEGARQGDRSLLLAFRERPEVLVSRARAFGMDLEGAIAAGLVQILHRSAATLEVDEALGAAREALGASSPARIVIDSIAELEQDLPDLGRRRRVMAWITDLVRAHGATGLILRETGQIIGPELEFSDSPLAVLAENVILLRYVELDRRLSRVVSILKVRDSAHDPSIREYEIAQTGAQVIAAGVGDPARLSRIAGLPEERRVKREGGPSPVSDPRSAGDDR